MAMKKAGDKLKSFCLYERMRRNSGSNDGKKNGENENINKVINQINQQMECAAALDLSRRPRLSRTNAGKCFFLFIAILKMNINSYWCVLLMTKVEIRRWNQNVANCSVTPQQ